MVPVPGYKGCGMRKATPLRRGCLAPERQRSLQQPEQQPGKAEWLRAPFPYFFLLKSPRFHDLMNSLQAKGFMIFMGGN